MSSNESGEDKWESSLARSIDDLRVVVCARVVAALVDGGPERAPRLLRARHQRRHDRHVRRLQHVHCVRVLHVRLAVEREEVRAVPRHARRSAHATRPQHNTTQYGTVRVHTHNMERSGIRGAKTSRRIASNHFHRSEYSVCIFYCYDFHMSS